MTITEIQAEVYRLTLEKARDEARKAKADADFAELVLSEARKGVKLERGTILS